MDFDYDRCCVFDGAIWRRKGSRTFYRWHVYPSPRRQFIFCSVTRFTSVRDKGEELFMGLPSFVAPKFKALARAENLEPKRRTRKERRGYSVELWWKT